MSKKHSQAELDEAYLSLMDEQKKVLDEYVKRGMKTQWLNAWAKKKGSVLAQDELDDPHKAMESLLEWELKDYEDKLRVDKNTCCECGRPLRYRYTVLHKKTGEIYKLGKVHFEQHTGLSPEMVRLISKGLESIDLERDEILSKVIDNWSMPMVIPLDLEVPKDMTEQLRVKLPLLDRQLIRLQIMIKQHLNEGNRSNYFRSSSWGNKITPVESKIRDNVSADDLPLSGYISNIHLLNLYNKLITKKITADEAKELYLFVKNHSPELDDYGVSIGDIKNAVNKVLGHFGRGGVRDWLAEIIYL